MTSLIERRKQTKRSQNQSQHGCRSRIEPPVFTPEVE